MEQVILIKYGELTTKKGNRKLFINLLEKNIKNLLKDYSVKIEKDRVRMFIYTNNINEVVDKLKKIFGIHSIVICDKVDNNIDSICKKSLEKINSVNGDTFKVITKRANKNFDVHSMEMNNIVASNILKNTSLKVDVHNPSVKLYIEIRDNYTYIYLGEILGSGGYPVGVQGKGLLMLSGGIDSPVSGYLALKRGVDIDCMYFESPPHTSIKAKQKVIDLAKIINSYSGNIKVHIVPFTKLQEEIYKNVPDSYNITIMRRMMYRIASIYSKKIKANVIINGESIGQVASQTLVSMNVINSVTNMPIIRPVACFDKLEIIELAKKINTYDISILPYEDCCTIFLPKHPVINPNKDKCILYENKIDYENLINECINNIETIELKEKIKNELL